jgi:YD repeat-containing protein
MLRYFKSSWVAILILFLLVTPVLAETIQYTYDSMNRLAMVQYGDGTTVAYTYDKMGNRLTMEVTQPVQAPSLLLMPFSSSSGAAVQEVPVPSSSPTGDSTTVGLGTLPGLQVYLEQLPQVSSVADAEKLRQDAFEYLDRSSLSPEDKASYKEQFVRSLEQQMESLTTKAETGGAPGTEKPASAAAASSPRKETKNDAPVKKNKIVVDQGKFYTQPPAKDE